MKTQVLNIVTSSHYVPSYGAHVEQESRMLRPYKLTCRGAERILRKRLQSEGTKWNGTVIRVETAIYQVR